MSLFSGAGGRGLAFGLADAMHNIPIEQRAAEDRRRQQAMQDEEMQQRRDEIANKRRQQDFQNTRDTAADKRAEGEYGMRQKIGQHSIDRQGVEDTQHDAAFGMNQQLTQGRIDALPLERAELKARIAAAGSAAQTQALQRELTKLELTAHHMDMSKKIAQNGAEDAISQSTAANSPEALDEFANTHLLPKGQSVQTFKNKDGTYTTNHYQEQPGPPGADQQPVRSLVNQQRFSTLGDMHDEVNSLVHQPELYKAQLYGLTHEKFQHLQDDQNNPVRFNSHDGKFYNTDGTPFKGKLSPSSAQVMQSLMNPQGMNGQPGAAAAPHPGSQFIQQSIGQPQVPGAASPVPDDAPPSWMQLGGGTSGQE